jgi:undecaprenyl-diphosphatase
MLESFDHSVFRYCYAGNSTGGLYLLMVAATAIGSGWSMLAAFPLVFRLRTRRFGLSLLATLSATGITVWALKAIIGRARPPFALAKVSALFGNPTDHSFPSGHAAGCFAFASFVGVICYEAGRAQPQHARKLRALSGFVFALAGVISYSRVYLGCHFPVDVLAGATLGTAFGFYGARQYLGSRRARKIGHTLAPVGEVDPK